MVFNRARKRHSVGAQAQSQRTTKVITSGGNRNLAKLDRGVVERICAIRGCAECDTSFS
jgi:hypothetical protein